MGPGIDCSQCVLITHSFSGGYMPRESEPICLTFNLVNRTEPANTAGFFIILCHFELKIHNFLISFSAIDSYQVL